MMTTYIIVSGTLEKGFNFIGPFPHQVLAQEWADAWEEDITWEIVPLINPKDREVVDGETVP